jgi:uncharacterized membrane-anchored protein
MRKLLIIIAVVLQVLLLVFMAGQRECVLRTGKTVYLRTIPVDPRDLFRGDYVRLRYEISNIECEKMQDGLKSLIVSNEYRDKNKDKKVYAILEIDEDNIANVVSVTDKKPEKGKLFIRGRVERLGNFLFVRYGIEAYFMQQGTGKDLERRNVGGNRLLEMEIALGSDGTAVIKNHRWAPISINLTDLKIENRIPQSAKLVLTNISEKPVAIVVLPNNGSLKVEHNRPAWQWGGDDKTNWRWVNENASAGMPEDKDVQILEPGDSYESAIDFGDPYWSISVNNKEPIAMNKYNFTGWSSFQIVYQPPLRQQCKDLKDADLIWHGKISSRSVSSSNWD